MGVVIAILISRGLLGWIECFKEEVKELNNFHPRLNKEFYPEWYSSFNY